MTTTMGYYQVSLKRKQQAIRSVAALATDAADDPAPIIFQVVKVVQDGA